MKSFREYLKESSLISEGKHWPKDYVKTAKNTIKAVIFSSNSPLLNNIKNEKFKTWSLKKEQIFIKKV